MTRTGISRAVLAGLSVIAVSGAQSMPRAALYAQAGTVSLPAFEVDRAWPKVPAKWKLGDPSASPSTHRITSGSTTGRERSNRRKPPWPRRR